MGSGDGSPPAGSRGRAPGAGFGSPQKWSDFFYAFRVKIGLKVVISMENLWNSEKVQ